MSFVTQDDVFAAIEPVLHGVFEEFGAGRTVTPAPFPRIPYRESMLKYGNDKPHLRNPIEIVDVTDHFRGSGFGLDRKRVVEGKRVSVRVDIGGGHICKKKKIISRSRKKSQRAIG